MSKADAELVELALSGELDNFEKLVVKYHQRVLALSYSQVRNFADAEDIAQETFLRAFDKLDTLKSPAKFAPWVARIAIIVSKDFLRERARKQIPLEKLHEKKEIQTPVIEAIKNETELDKVISSVMSELPADIQGVVALRFFENLSYKEIASFLDLPVSTVRGALFRGTKYLRKRLKPYIEL